MEVSRAFEFSDIFLSGQKISMALVFQDRSANVEARSRTQCPHRQESSKELRDVDILW